MARRGASPPRRRHEAHTHRPCARTPARSLCASPPVGGSPRPPRGGARTVSFSKGVCACAPGWGDRGGLAMSPAAPRRACRCGRIQPCPVHVRLPWAGSRRASRQSRGYGRDHERLRRIVLAEEPVCQSCRVAPSEVCDHIVPLHLGGATVRENLQGLCGRCSRAKSGREGRQAQLAAQSSRGGSAARPLFQRSLKSRGGT
jgi:5-methylcytosine-specific restriction protein A